MTRFGQVPIAAVIILGLTTFLLGAMAVVLLISWSQNPILCNGGPGGAACVREWTAATSGWGGALVTVVTIFYLAKQVKALNTPYVKMRLDDLLSEERIAHSMLKQYDCFRDGNYHDIVENFVELMIYARASLDEVTDAQKSLSDIGAIYMTSFRDVMSCQALAGGNDLIEARVAVTKEIHKIGIGISKIKTRMTDEFSLRIGLTPVPEPTDFDDQFLEVDEEMTPKSMKNLTKVLQNWHIATITNIRSRKIEIDRMLDS